MSKKKQDEIARFFALHGREPNPEEIGLTETVIDRARKAIVEMSPLSDADHVAAAEAVTPEETIDRKRDTRALQEFIARLSAKDRREFWSGNRPDLTQRAKLYVEGRRGACRTR